MSLKITLNGTQLTLIALMEQKCITEVEQWHDLNVTTTKHLTTQLLELHVFCKPCEVRVRIVCN